MTHTVDPRRHFDDLYAASEDPWHFKARWYESRKRALTLACLPRPRYTNAYEPGCANGELSAALAERCDRLLISDGAAAAVALAARRVAAHPHVRVVQAWVPDDWPDERFDLIVLSELAYYLKAPALASLARQARASLLPGGHLVACHWRHPIAGCPLQGDAVHAVVAQACALPQVWSLTDPDFRLEIWSQDTRSVGTCEGLVGAA